MDAVRTEVAGQLQDHSVGWSNGRKGWFLAVASTVSLIATIDRQLTSVLLQPIKDDLHASDTQMALLTGAYFSLFQIIALFPLARLADFGNRKNLVAFAIAAWSIAMMLCGLAQTYTQLAITICLVAIGEAGSGPASASLIADIFRPGARARVFGLLIAGGAAGVALGVFLGGTLNDIVGWRHVYMVIGAPGVLLALVYFLTIKEPARPPAARQDARPSIPQSLRALWKIPTYRLMLFLTMMETGSGYATLTWSPAAYMRLHHLSAHQVGSFMSLALILGSMTGCLTSGFIGDHLQKRSAKWLLYVSGFGSLTMAPFSLLIALFPSVNVAIAAGGGFMFFASLYGACNAAAVMAVAPPRLRALASALAGLFTTFGAAMGPLLVGVMNDRFAPYFATEAVRYSLALSTIPGVVAGLAAVIFAPMILRDIAKAKALATPGVDRTLAGR